MSAAVTALSVAVLLLGVPTRAPAQHFAIPGKFDVSGGAATYSIPISVPPGTAGTVPALSLSYSSQGGNGIVGVGWSLSGLPSINRCAQTFALDGVRGGINYDNNDRYCLDGQRMVVISGTYGADGAEYRTEIDTFSRIISHGTAGNGPASFEVHTKAGQIMQFGNTADSLVLAQGKTTARSWAVDKVSDTKGNYFTVTYTNDTSNGQVYPIEIDYTGNSATGLAPYNKVQFVYATRPDITPVYHAGSLMRTTVRLTDVQTYTGTSLVADYKLAYQQSPSTQNSEVTSITLCAGDGSCLPATTVNWTAGGPSTFTQLQNTVAWNFGSQPGVAGDFNADGKTDYMIPYWTATGPSGSSILQYSVLFFSNGDGTFNPTTVNGINDGFHVSPFPQCGTVVDLNGDGKADCILLDRFAQSSTRNMYSSLGKGDGTFAQTLELVSNTGGQTGDFNGDGRSDIVIGSNVQFSNGDGTYSTASKTTGTLGSSVMGDFNGDGKTDTVSTTFTDRTSCRSSMSTELSNGDGSFTTVSVPLTVSITAPGTCSSGAFFSGDFNGDGKTDFMMIDGATQTVFMSRGDGTFAQQTNTIPTNFGSPITAYFLAVGDFNGDGKTDYLLTQNTTNYIFLSNGDGTFTQQTSTFATSIGTPADGIYSVTIGDFNGDGKTDYLLTGNSTQMVFLANGGPTDLAQSITTGAGVTSAITYRPLTQAGVYTKDTNAVYPVQDVQAPIYVVSRVDTSNGIGGTRSSTYTYAGAKLDLSGLGFLGFRQMTATDLQTGITVTTTNRQDYPYVGQTASSTKTLGPVTLSSTTNTYQFSNASGAATVSTPGVTSAPYQVSLAQSVATGADLDGTALPAVTTSSQFDAYGNPTRVVVTTSDGFSKITTSTYTNDTTNWFLGRLTGATVTSTTP